jgi:DNA-binding MarR family transcriptional regulator
MIGEQPLPPEPLSLGPLPHLIGYALRRSQLAVFADFMQCFAELRLRPAQFSTLLVLRHNPGPRPSQVADALGIKRANFVTLQGDLIARGLVERRGNARDRRAHSLHLTPDGEALLVRADATLAKHESGFAAKLGQQDYETLLRILHRLRHAPHEATPT